MNPNDEIVKLAVELASSLADPGISAWNSMTIWRAKANAILALTAPAEREPMPWPGGGGTPAVVELEDYGWYVRAGTDGWDISGPLCPTPAAAIDAWDETMKRLVGTGLSREERWAIATAITCLRNECCPQNADRLQAILDAHAEGGGA